jgi:hypothetical protein
MYIFFAVMMGVNREDANSAHPRKPAKSFSAALGKSHRSEDEMGIFVQKKRGKIFFPARKTDFVD